MAAGYKVMDEDGTTALINEAVEDVANDLIDWAALEIIFELHRAVKLGYYRELIDPDPSNIEKREIVVAPGLDVFGQTAQESQLIRDQKTCPCPKCGTVIGVSKCAPHLEKCMGMGRNSGRLATKRPPVILESDSDDSDADDGDDYIPDNKGFKKPKREGKEREKEVPVPSQTDSPRRGVTKQPVGNGDTASGNSSASEKVDKIKPSTLQHTVSSFRAEPPEKQKQLLEVMCGVVSERTKRLCSRSINCPQHTEDQRKEIRIQLCRPLETSVSPATKKKAAHHSVDDDISELESLIPPASSSSNKKNNWETSSTVSTASSISQGSFAQPHKEAKSKKKALKAVDKKSKKKKKTGLKKKSQHEESDRESLHSPQEQPSPVPPQQKAVDMPDMPIFF